MRVLLISHTCQNHEGQPKAWQLAQMPGVELTVLSPDRWFVYGEWKRAVPPQNAPFRFVVGKVMWPWSGKGQWYLHWYPSLARLMRSFQPDVIDLWEEPWGLVSAHACWLREHLAPHAKIVSETEQNILKALPPPFETFRRYTLQRADFCVARNTEATEVLRAKGFAGETRVVPNAVDAELFRPMHREECRAKWGSSGFVVGYVGRLVEEKGLMDALEALPHCATEVNFLLVGTGDFQAALEKRAQELGLSSRVRFVGAKPSSELPSVMNAMDVLILPSRTTLRWKEQFGRVLIEAHACQVPVIGSDSGAIPDVVGQGGLVVPEGDATAIAQAIETLRMNPSMGRAMGEAGRRQVEAHYTWRRVAEKMYGIYQDVLR
jgi:glycosyltransferase involved in cell wall biosynthesis